MKKLVLLFFILTCFLLQGFTQTDTATLNDIHRFQEELLHEYDTDSLSPLSADAKKEFKGIHFFTVDTQFICTADFVRTKGEKAFQMPTSGSVTKLYVKYGEAHFTINNKPYKLNVYQSINLTRQRKYRNYLFIPFRDATSGKETYGGGRYIDLTIPQGDKLVINFNKAYHPYCAYTEGYNCPIPPRENFIPVKIEAGVKY